MKATAFFTLALAGAVVAQDGIGLPQCAQDCATNFLNGGIGNCGRDIACICADKDFLGQIACCLAKVCNQDDQDKAVSIAAGFCKAAGVTGLPTSVACATASAAKTSSEASSAASSAAGSSTTGSTPASASSSGATAAPTGTGNAAATQSTGTSSNFGPRPTAAAGLGAIGGIIAAVALL